MKITKNTPQLNTLLSIAGSDCSGGAGIQNDIRTAAEFGWHCLTAVTAITAQNSNGVKAIAACHSTMLKAQLEAISDEFIPKAVKIGIVGSLDNIEVISEYIKNLPGNVPVVIDPVLSASAGGKLFSTAGKNDISDQDFTKAYIEKLIPYSSLITPNLSELNILMPETIGLSPSDAATEFMLKFNKPIFLTGIEEKKGYLTDYILFRDEFITTEKIEIISPYTENEKMLQSYNLISNVHEKLNCNNLHGTGCLLSSIMAMCLGYGMFFHEALQVTNDEIKKIIIKSRDYKLGKSKYGPLNINNYFLGDL